MNTSENQRQISLSKSILSGFLAGVAVALLGLIYTVVYRDSTGYAYAKIIMPISIILGSPILLLLAGFLYYLLRKHLPGGSSWFAIFYIALLVALVLVTIVDTHKEGGGLFSGLRGLCLGLESIMCLAAVLLIPYFVRHPQIYE